MPPARPAAEPPREAAEPELHQPTAGEPAAAAAVPVNPPQTVAVSEPSAARQKDISALTALLVMLVTPLIGLAYFLLFPFIGAGIALAVIGKELWKLARR